MLNHFFSVFVVRVVVVVVLRFSNRIAVHMSLSLSPQDSAWIHSFTFAFDCFSF